MIDRLLAGLDERATISRAHHLDVHGPLPDVGPDLIGEVERAGLRGRGGAGFPTAVKLAAVASGSRPVVVVNGTEGEPMSAKDRLLLASAPHLVLDGAVAAAAAVGAREVARRGARGGPPVPGPGDPRAQAPTGAGRASPWWRARRATSRGRRRRSSRTSKAGRRCRA